MKQFRNRHCDCLTTNLFHRLGQKWQSNRGLPAATAAEDPSPHCFPTSQSSKTTELPSIHPCQHTCMLLYIIHFHHQCAFNIYIHEIIILPSFHLERERSLKTWKKLHGRMRCYNIWTNLYNKNNNNNRKKLTEYCTNDGHGSQTI